MFADMRLKEEAKKNAFSKFEQSHKAAKSGDMEKPSERHESGFCFCLFG